MSVLKWLLLLPVKLVAMLLAAALNPARQSPGFFTSGGLTT